MAPKRGESIERTDGYEEFMKTLTDYHEKRGTHLEPEPKVGIRHIDLLKLYKRVVDEGGYDLVSDTKAKPLMWRRFAEEFVGKNQYTAAQAFQMKQIYYKSLVAYEISDHWKKEPPPKEILEDVSAKGGNVMTRTVENFVKASGRDGAKLQEDNGDSPEQQTPKAEKPDPVEDPGSATGRSTRGLRHQPPQRVLFQPDLNSARQTRGQVSAANPSPTPGMTTNGITNAPIMTNGASSTLAAYEPSQSYPLSLKPVVTPANNPDYYRNERKRKLEANAGPIARKYRNIMLPGTGFIGPNIYVRAQLALQSGIADEERYALHHLVKISHERGDKYRFDQFPGLAEALVRKVLQASSLFYDIEWDVNYDDDTFFADDETLNGLHGTPDIITKLKSRLLRINGDGVLGDDILDQMNRITEASLVFRNMCMMDDNARYVAGLPLTRDVLAVAMSLPDHWTVTELRHYALETAEQVLKYCDVDTQEALYKVLLTQLHTQDRGTAIMSMRVISRVAMALPPPKKLENVAPQTLHRIQDWLLVEDEDLRQACLDFLMQYTSFADNVENLLQVLDGEMLTRQLSRLLLFDAKEHRQQVERPRSQSDTSIPPVPRLSRSIVEGLIKLEEPERSSEWLRMCFLPDPNAEMTQISLWQAYQGTFGAFHATHPHLIAGEFIKNVSAVFTGATAQVAGQNKYVIKGIRSRKVPVDIGTSLTSRTGDKGKELMKCCWKVTTTVNGQKDANTGHMTAPTTRDADCGEWFRSSEDMLNHILGTHLTLPARPAEKKEASNPDAMDIDSKPVLTNGHTENTIASSLPGSFDFRASDKTTYRCQWAGCDRLSSQFETNKLSRTLLFRRHVRGHLPDPASRNNKHNIKPDGPPFSTPNERLYLSILTDEKNDAAGLPLSAALVLSHIARFMPNSLSSSKDNVRAAMGAEKEGSEEEKLIERVLGSDVKERIFFALAYCPPARTYVNNILRNIRRSGG